MSRAPSRAWVVVALSAATVVNAQITYTPETFAALEWRNIGPNRGGRSIAVAGSQSRPLEYYFGATGGGLWKTTDGGVSWRPVTDGQIDSSSVGAVAVAPSNPDIIYIGMGEVQLRGNVMQGDGVYKSTDAGATWEHMGLAAIRAVARIRVHPENPDLVYVAALGDPTGPNDARGIFRSRNGGRDWGKILFESPQTGAVDLLFDPSSPDVLYASMWQVYRNAYQLWSGGPESGLFKSTDGGDHWTALTTKPGFPEGPLGKIGITVAAKGARLYAVIEAEDGGLYRSDDRGESWKHVNSSRDLWQRSFYFNRIAADPKDPDTVYVLNFLLFKSEDAGETFEQVRTPHADHHDLWIDPNDPTRMVCANDGGGTVSTNGGASWTPQNYPTAQMYHVNTTAEFPYHVVGAQQDNSTAAVPSYVDGWWTTPRGRPGDDYYAVGGGENAYVATHPANPNVFFAGATNTLTRFDRATGAASDVQPYPRLFMGESSRDIPERWNWVYPIVITRSEPHTLYTGSQHVWRSRDEGNTWEKISPDLTRADPETLGPSGGPIVLDQDGPEVYATVFAIAPSEQDARVVWAGSDDGLVHITKDGGAEWRDVTPQAMVRDTRVSLIEASPHDPAAAYVAAKRNQMGDRAPYIWKTDDYGETWTSITSGIAAEDFVHAIREDPKRRGLLYAGTEHGIYVSFDDGEGWQSLSLNLPDVQVPDLIVEERDLVIATHGRSFYVLDDIGPLRQVGRASFRPTDAVRRIYPANIDLYVEPSERVDVVEILDARGELVRRLSIDGIETGLNRLRWDLRYPGATVFEGMVLESPSPRRGPWAPPGTYSVRIRTSRRTTTEAFAVLKDPRLEHVSITDLEEQFRLASQVRDRTSDANEAVISIRVLKMELHASAAPESLAERLTAIEAKLYQIKNQSPKDKIAFPIQLNDRLAGLLFNIQRADGRPNRAHYQVFDELSTELDGYLSELEKLEREAQQALASR